MATAVETWYADQSPSTAGDPTEAGLVTAKFIRSQSTLYDVGASGAVNPQVGGACV
jgi:hypothetical protein